MKNFYIILFILLFLPQNTFSLALSPEMRGITTATAPQTLKSPAELAAAPQTEAQTSAPFPFDIPRAELKLKELTTLLTQHGYEFRRGGKHPFIATKPGAASIPIPAHGSRIKKHLGRVIMKEISRDEDIELSEKKEELEEEEEEEEKLDETSTSTTSTSETTSTKSKRERGWRKKEFERQAKEQEEQEVQRQKTEQERKLIHAQELYDQACIKIEEEKYEEAIIILENIRKLNAIPEKEIINTLALSYLKLSLSQYYSNRLNSAQYLPNIEKTLILLHLIKTEPNVQEFISIIQIYFTFIWHDEAGRLRTATTDDISANYEQACILYKRCLDFTQIKNLELPTEALTLITINATTAHVRLVMFYKTQSDLTNMQKHLKIAKQYSIEALNAGIDFLPDDCNTKNLFLDAIIFLIEEEHYKLYSLFSPLKIQEILKTYKHTFEYLSKISQTNIKKIESVSKNAFYSLFKMFSKITKQYPSVSITINKHMITYLSLFSWQPEENLLLLALLNTYIFESYNELITTPTSEGLAYLRQTIESIKNIYSYNDQDLNKTKIISMYIRIIAALKRPITVEEFNIITEGINPIFLKICKNPILIQLPEYQNFFIALGSLYNNTAYNFINKSSPSLEDLETGNSFVQKAIDLQELYKCFSQELIPCLYDNQGKSLLLAGNIYKNAHEIEWAVESYKNAVESFQKGSVFTTEKRMALTNLEKYKNHHFTRTTFSQELEATKSRARELFKQQNTEAASKLMAIIKKMNQEIMSLKKSKEKRTDLLISAAEIIDASA